MTERLYRIDWDYSSLKYCPAHELEAYERRQHEVSPKNAEILEFWIGPRDKEYYARKYIEVYEAEIQKLSRDGKLGTKEHRDCLYFRSFYAYRLMHCEENTERYEAIEERIRETRKSA